MILVVLAFFLATGTGSGNEPAPPLPGENESAATPVNYDEQTNGTGQGPAPAKIEAHTIVDGFAGYRFLSVNHNGGNAAQYEYLHSNPAFYSLASYLDSDTRVSVEGGYLNDKDYHGELSYDYKGIYRFKFWTESLFHNLGHDQLFKPDFTLGGSSYTANDPLPGALYGVRVEQDLAQFRYKPERFPFHLNLGYWRLLREGTTQMIYADQAFEGPVNTVYSKTRKVDGETHEGQIGFDAHMGYFDLIYDFRIREFINHAGTPRDFFSARLDPKEQMPRAGGLLEHSDAPDSRFLSNKIGLHTSMSGGLVGAVSYNLGKRENLVNLGDVRGADQTYTITHNVAGDLSYTPCGYFSFALKYRHLEVDRHSPPAITYIPAVTPRVGVRPAVNTDKDTITATFTYKPVKLLSLKGEYRGEFLSRDNLDPWVVTGRIASLNYPEHSDTHTGTLTLLSRPITGMRIYAQYLYSAADKPIYASSYEEKHEGSFKLSYNATNRWGLAANARISRENSDHLSVTTIVPDPAIPVTTANTATYQMPKNRRVANSTLSVWVVPLKKLTVTGSYGLLRNGSDQGILFAGPLQGSNTMANYTQQAQVFGINSTYHVDEKCDLSLGLQQVRSYAQFDPRFIMVGPTNNTAGIKQLSQIKTVESSLSARADYRFSKNLSSALEYSFRDYADKIASLFNGSVNSVMLYVSAKW
jgi:Putative outer membrane beta-barrel porin, MtrB/PioB